MEKRQKGIEEFSPQKWDFYYVYCHFEITFLYEIR